MTVKQEESREAEELSPEQVIDWLRSDDGQRWSVTWMHKIRRHGSSSGVFGELIPDARGGFCGARRPEPVGPVPL
jgi:hypothetical protein